MTRRTPTTTVVIPTHNRVELLRLTSQSALAQEDVEVEVVVVDEGSSDGTQDWLAGLADPRLKVIRHDKPQGVARARNAGLAVATGEWVGFLDDDDLWAPGKLRAQLAAAAAQSADFVYSGSVWTDLRRRAIHSNAVPHPAALPWLILRRNFVPAGSSNVVARREVLLRLGGFDEALFQIADWDLWIRLANTHRGAACDEPLVGYLSHPANMVATHDPKRVLREFEHLVAKHRSLTERRGIDFDRVAFSRFAAQGWIRSGRPRRAGAFLLSTGIRYRDGGPPRNQPKLWLSA